MKKEMWGYAYILCTLILGDLCRGCMLDAYWREASGEDENGVSEVDVESRH